MVASGRDTQLFARLSEPAVRTDAALALLLGADPDTARRTVTYFDTIDSAALEKLKGLYERSLGYWSDADVDNGNLARWIANAEAASHVKVAGKRQDWTRAILARGVQAIDFDNGPRSITRVQLRERLVRGLRGADEKKRAEALRLLRFMNEKGALM